MATCNVNTLLADGNCFVCLRDDEQAAIQIVLLQEIAGNTQTKDELIAAGQAYIGLTEKQQRGIIAQLLCEIREA